MKKRIIIAVCFVLSVIMLLTSCNDNVSPNETESASEASEASIVLFNEDGSLNYTIVRPTKCSARVENEISNMCSVIGKLSDKELNIKIDSLDEVDDDGICRNGDKEILLGKTNRAETNEVLSSLSEDEYAMRIINDKIVVVGSSDIATQKAIEEFRNKYISKFEKGKQTVIEKSSTFSGFYDGVVDLCEGAELRVMTLNVALSGDEPSKRIEHIINLIEQYEPDIFCLQECNAFMHTNLVYKLKTNYGIAFEKHQDSDVYIYTPILYRKDKINLVEGGGEWLDSRYVGTNTKCLSWGVFELNSTDEKFFVLSLHGAVLNNSYSGYENKSKEELQAEETKMRADNVRQMLDVEKSIQKKYGKLPAIFAGDFNFAKNELPYQVATNAGLTEAEVSATVSKMPGYKTTHSVGEPPTTEARYSIDHIFYYPESIKAYVHYVGVKTEDELWASDHLMVYSDVEILG